MNPVWLVLAVVMGAFLAIQPTLNAEIGRHVGGTMHAALVNFCTGFAVLVAFMLLFRSGLPDVAGARGAPWWAWFGGVIGATFVVSGTFLTPRIGVTALVASILLGQLVASLLIDHFGAFNVTVREISLERLAGIGLAGLAVVLVSRG